MFKIFRKKVNNENVWNDIESVDNVDKDKIDFIHDYSLKRLESSLNISNNLDNKILAMLCFYIAALTALIGFGLANYIDIKNFKILNQEIFITQGVLILGFFISSIFLIWENLPRKYMPLGNEPKNLFNKEILSYSLRAIKSGEIVGLQDRIESNINRNNGKSNAIRLSVICLFITILIAILSTLPLFT